MEGLPKKENKEPRFNFAKTLEEITKFAEEKLGSKGRKHHGAGEKVLSSEDSKPFFIGQAEESVSHSESGREIGTERNYKTKKNGPGEHEADPYNGDYLI